MNEEQAKLFIQIVKEILENEKIPFVEKAKGITYVSELMQYLEENGKTGSFEILKYLLEKGAVKIVPNFNNRVLK